MKQFKVAITSYNVKTIKGNVDMNCSTQYNATDMLNMLVREGHTVTITPTVEIKVMSQEEIQCMRATKACEVRLIEEGYMENATSVACDPCRN